VNEWDVVLRNGRSRTRSALDRNTRRTDNGSNWRTGEVTMAVSVHEPGMRVMPFCLWLETHLRVSSPGGEEGPCVWGHLAEVGRMGELDSLESSLSYWSKCGVVVWSVRVVQVRGGLFPMRSFPQPRDECHGQR
jgi:hypothetical protein